MRFGDKLKDLLKEERAKEMGRIYGVHGSRRRFSDGKVAEGGGGLFENRISLPKVLYCSRVMRLVNDDGSTQGLNRSPPRDCV